MKYNGQEIKEGAVIVINGHKRIVTRVERDSFQTDPYMEKVIKKVETSKEVEDVINPPTDGETEEVVVKKTRGRGKSK